MGIEPRRYIARAHKNQGVITGVIAVWYGRVHYRAPGRDCGHSFSIESVELTGTLRTRSVRKCRLA
jgi:hypothetical protein